MDRAEPEKALCHLKRAAYLIEAYGPTYAKDCSIEAGIDMGGITMIGAHTEEAARIINAILEKDPDGQIGSPTNRTLFACVTMLNVTAKAAKSIAAQRTPLEMIASDPASAEDTMKIFYDQNKDRIDNVILIIEDLVE